MNIEDAAVYVGTYAKYNNGSIEGKWLKLAEYDDKESFYDACSELHSDEADPEFMFQDHENIPESFISESYISDEFFELAEHIRNSHLDGGVFMAGLELDIPLESIEDAYQGKFSSDEDFAYDMAEQTGSLSDNESWPYTCIDWERAARNLMYDYNCYSDHYFSANW